ncbi:MAG: c-type cytochrome biogenesis protein CcmI [Roseinatronobacter sp.]
MVFWGQVAGFAVLVLMVGAVLVRAVMRAGASEVAGMRERSLQVYRDQLAEVERDLERGTLQSSEAERLRLEISRRILDVDKSGRADLRAGPAGARIAALGVILVALAGSAFLYLGIGAAGYPDMPLAQRHADALEARRNRPSQAVLEAQFLAAFPDPEPFEGRDTLEGMVAQLREALARRPDDATGFTLLAQNEARLGNMAAAIAAQVRVIEIKGDAVTAPDLAFLLDLMALATGGVVSPEAEAVIERALRLDPAEPIALYYLGRMYAQTGRPDMTFRVWRRLHEVSRRDDPWMPEIRAALPDLSRISGEPRWTLPPLPAVTSAGPSAAEIEAAAEMSPEDRMAMIEQMVDGLMARLANDGGTAQDWAQLVRALTVLDRRDQAQTILQEARTVFAARADDLALINDMARAVGLTGTAP